MFKFLKKAFQDFTDKALKPEKLRPTENSTLVEKSEPSKPVEVQKLDAKTSFLESITKAVTETKISEDYFEKIFQDLEIELIQNNVAYDIIEKIKIRLNKQLVGKSVKRSELSGIIKKELRTLILEILELPTPIAIDTFIENARKKPVVIMFVGTNGHGKTTTLAKVGHLLKNKGLKCIFAAGDTFRAAAQEQLQEHGDKLGIKVIKHTYGSDAAAVAFDAVKHAEARQLDAVLIDTAGRQHSDKNLMDELKKIKKVVNPNLTIYVCESIAGNDAWEQGKNYNTSIGIDGMILTKSDVDDKGGTFISLVHETGKPIMYVGTGQEYEKLQQFQPQKFINNII
ncbi:MAG: signal recognition particle-docking protein FtsY [DPANN group archaeon]|nr:signal recognition particle-docking protein FtsY [DPANN group archaeon]